MGLKQVCDGGASWPPPVCLSPFLFSYGNTQLGRNLSSLGCFTNYSTTDLQIPPSVSLGLSPISGFVVVNLLMQLAGTVNSGVRGGSASYYYIMWDFWRLVPVFLLGIHHSLVFDAAGQASPSWLT